MIWTILQALGSWVIWSFVIALLFMIFTQLMRIADSLSSLEKMAKGRRE